MKKLQILFSFSILYISCSSDAGSSSKKAYKDSVLYHQVAPGKLSTTDFKRYYDAINAFYDTNLVARNFNGAILVAKNGQIIFEKYHGYFDLDKKDTLTEHSAFHLASVSKTFTAMATLKLAEEGRLTLDDDVKTFFPSFPYNNITIKMLLSHRSGLPNYLYFMEQLGWNKTAYCDNNDVLNYLIQYQPPISHQPNTHFSYCNTNYVLLALIIEKASGSTYSEYLQHTFFTPLKMNDTYVFTLADTQKAMPSYNWRGRAEPLTFLDKAYGDKNIYSTVKDLLKWDQALYNDQLFNQETLKEAFTPYSNEKPGIKNYGYGWRMNNYPTGKKIIFHGGWWHGSNTMLMRLIQDSATIIILGNRYNRNVYEAKKIANIFSPYFETDEEENPDSKELAMANEYVDSLINKKTTLAHKADPLQNVKRKFKKKR
ncbi:MAG TPA: serine hydrolase domain-containing protein [Chitinophagaceae bacterium]|nr:serine hydrolase domain-containing protein [Chitinophagaceae bacterium]